MKTHISDIIQYLHSERDRWVKDLRIDEDDPYIGDTTIGLREVLNAHFLLAEFFASTGEGLGGLGPKEPNLLHSALSPCPSRTGSWNVLVSGFA
jgi:hypothetical protein